MRKRIFGLAIVAAALLFNTGCATVHRTVVGGRPELTYAATAPAALVPHLVAAEAAAGVAAEGDCLRFQQTNRGGTTSLQTGGWNCGAVGALYGYGQYGGVVTPGYGPGELEALAARSYGSGVVASMPSPAPGTAPAAGTTTDPALAARVQSLEQSVQAVVNAQAEALASPPAR